MGASGCRAGSLGRSFPCPGKQGLGFGLICRVHQPTRRNSYGAREAWTAPASPTCAGPESGRLASSASIAAICVLITTPIGDYGGDIAGDDGQPDLPSGGHVELPGGGQRDYSM
jgi:hypothetical protein